MAWFVVSDIGLEFSMMKMSDDLFFLLFFCRYVDRDSK